MSKTHHRAYEPEAIPMPSPAGNAAGVVDILDATNQGMNDGDLLWFNEATGKNFIQAANHLAWTTDLPTTQRRFAEQFVGVLLGGVAKDDIAGSRTVMIGGEYEFPCASAKFQRGQLLGVAKQSGNALERSKVVAVTDPALAIAVVSRVYSTATTAVKGWLRPRRSEEENPQSMIHQLSIAMDVNPAANMIVGLDFGRRVKLRKADFIADGAITGTSVLTFKKNAAAFTGQTLSCAGAAGVVSSVTFIAAPTANADESEFGYGDTLTVASDGAATGGGPGTLVLTLVDLPSIELNTL